VNALFLDDDSDEEELLTELDAELQLRTSPRRQQTALQGHGQAAVQGQGHVLNGLVGVDSAANGEMCRQFEAQLLQLQDTILQKDKEIYK
jgi:hypothetical protein